jgi:selenocysteine lyase/cysteine desulfurase
MWLRKKGITEIASCERAMGERLLEGLLGTKGVSLAGKRGMDGRLPVFSFNLEGIDNGTLADDLSRAGFETRPGLHCAPLAHRTLGTFPEGTLRVSPGYFNTGEQINAFIEQIRRANS